MRRIEMKLRLIGLLLILVLVACGGGGGEEELSPSEIHSTYIESLNTGDIDSVMELFADNATFQSYEDVIIVGKADIKDYLETKMNENIQVVSEVTGIYMGAEVKVREEVTFGGNSLDCFAKYNVASGKISVYSWYFE
jgi:hypothetical protein